jgi:predicted outer membrane repeat protein
VEALEGRLAPAIIWVPRTADDGRPGTLRAAIIAANDGDTIQFTAGLSGTINLATKLPDLGKNLTISGQGAFVSVACNAQPVFRVFTVDSGKTCEIDNLDVYDGGISNGGTLTLNSVVVTHSQAASGGGIENSGSLTLNYCSVSFCSATDAGGGIYNTNQLVCSNTQIDYNSCTDGNGGGIYSASSFGSSPSVEIKDGSTIYSNSSGNLGGGIYSSAGTVTMTGGSVDNNTAQVDGGGVAIDGANATLTSVQVTNNVVRRTGGEGGGCFLWSGSLTLNQITLSGNSATTGGGVAWVTGSSFSDNNPVQVNDPIVEVPGP